MKRNKHALRSFGSTESGILLLLLLFGFVGISIGGEAASVYSSSENLIAAVQQTRAAISTEYDRLKQNDSSALSNWIAYSELLKPINNALLDSIFPALSMGENLNLSSDCMLTLFDLAQAIDQQQTWAYRILDSSGNFFPSGFMSGSFSHLGDFDQCLETTMPSFGETSVQGKYCLLKFNLHVPTNKSRLLSQDNIFNTSGSPLQNTFFADILKYGHVLKVRSAKIGVCLPSACTRDDIQSVANYLFAIDKVSVHVDSCQTAQDYGHYSSLQLSILGILVSLLILVVFATVFELRATSRNPKFSMKSGSIFVDFLLNFSAYSNTKSLLNTKIGSENLRSINGIRVLTMFWLVYAHAYFLSIKETFRSSSKFIESIYDLKMYFILNAWPAVEVFFIISALLHSYHTFKAIHSTHKINVPKLIANRIARLWPNLWLTVGLVFLVPSFAQGPMWPDVMQQQVSSCYDIWWKVPMFISNFRSCDQTCQVHTWYLSVDMQLYVLSFIFIFLFYKLRQKAIYLTIAIAVFISSFLSVYFYVKHFVPTILFNNVEERQIYEDMANVYMPTYYHFTPYLVGIITGFLLWRAKKTQTRVLKSLNIFLWFACGLIFVAVILSGYFFTAFTETSLANQSVYAGYHRLLWSGSVSYLIFACENKQGGIFANILSHPMFVPLGKLSYLVYLIHFIVTWARTGYTRATLVYSNYTLLNEFIVNLVYSLVLAFVFYLLVEAPFNKLYSNYIGKRSWFFSEWQFDEDQSTTTKENEKQDIDIEAKCVKC